MENRSPFHEQLKYERERRGWSQADIAERVRCDTKTVGRWESGERLPRPYLRQALCELFGKNAEELGLVRKHTKAMHQQPSSSLPAPDVPVVSLLPASTPPLPDQSTMVEVSADESTSAVFLREDWDEAPQAMSLCGREKESSELAEWIGDRRCQVVAVLGMGGIGKTALALTVATQVKESFEYIFWRSLQNALPLELILKQCLRFLSDQQPIDLPEDLHGQLSLLIHYLRSHHCLLVLDNVESIMQVGKRAGQYQERYEGYGRLIKLIGETQHQSCLLLTSREKPKEVARLEGKTSPVRSLYLSGIEQTAGQELLKEKGLLGSQEEWTTFVGRYSGNPLALQLASEVIQEVFRGDIARFLQEETIAFGDLNDLLDQHFQRLSDDEQESMYWLAIEREAVPLEELRENLVHTLPSGALLETLDSLRRRSMIETRGSAHFTLQPVIMEYVTTHLLKRAYQEFTQGTGVWLSHALIKTSSKEYVRESQIRLLLAPVSQYLLTTLGKKGIERTARSIISGQRQLFAQQPTYLAGNVLNLLSYLACDLHGFDFSDLMVRQAYLQQVSLPQVNFAHAHFVGTVFTSTFGNVLSVACSSKGNLLAAGTTTSEVWVYDLLHNALLLTCRGHTDGVWSVAFSPHGHLLASSSDDQTIRLWDIDTGHCLHLLQDHTNRVRAVAFTPDGSLLVSGSDDQTIRIWDVRTSHCLKTLQGHTGRVWSVASSPDGKLLASGSTDQTIRLWNVSTGDCLEVLEGHRSWVRSVVFRSDGRMLASGSDDQTIRLWETGTGSCLKILRGHTSRVWSVAFSPDGQTVASGSEDLTIRLWDSGAGHCLKTLQGHAQGVRSVAFNSDGHLLVSGGDDQTCRLWDTNTSYCLKTLQGYTNRVLCIAFNSDGNILASVSEDQQIHLWDVQVGHHLRTLHDGTHRSLVVAFSPNGQTLASGGQDQTIRIWEVGTGHCLKTLRGHTNWVRTVAFSPDGNLLASGSEDHMVCLWDISTGQNLSTLEGHSSWVRSVTFSPDGRLLASGSDDQSIRVWEVSTGHCLTMLQAHTNRVRSIAFSPDGRLLVSGSEDQTVRLWEVSTGRCFNTIQGHSSWVRIVAFSPDGRLLASGSEDRTVRLWDVSSGHCLKILQGHSSRVRWVAFTPDGSILASSSDDGTIRLWNVQTTECLSIFIDERPYEGMNITGVQGLTVAQKASLQALGAIEDK